MITLARLALAVAATGGLVLASRVLRAKPAPWPLSPAHAGLGALGLVLLIDVLAQGGWLGERLVYHHGIGRK